MTESVFVSGATGYIAQHIIKQLIKSNYKVIGSVRTVEKGERLKKNLDSDNFQFEIVEDLVKDGVFDEPLRKHPEVTVFLHTASPVDYDGDDFEKGLLLPAIMGTKNVLKAIKKNGPQIKRVVVTSSYVAVNSGASPRAITNGTITEETWTDITYEEALKSKRHAYAGSKTFAEKAAWDFVREEKPNFALSVVNPVFVFGPQAFDENAKGTLNFSANFVASQLKLKPNDSIPSFAGSFIDVRDVAQAHIVAFTSENTIGKRLLTISSNVNLQAILNSIRKQFPELCSKLPVGEPEKVNLETTLKIDTTFTKKVLGFKYRELDQSIYDTVKQYLEVNNI